MPTEMVSPANHFCLKFLNLPLFAGHHAADFLRQIDAGLLPQSEHGCVLGDASDAQLLRQRVEISVAGLIDGFGSVDRAMSALDPALEKTPVESSAAAAVDFAVSAKCPPASRPPHMMTLNTEPGASCAWMALFISGLAGSVIRVFHSLLRDADGERVGIKRRPAHHRQYFAGARVHGDDGAGLARQRLFGGNLQVDIDGQLAAACRERPDCR